MNKKTCEKRVLNQSQHGKLIKCITCDQYHIEFNNLHFTFNRKEFVFFRNYILDLDFQYWESLNSKTIYKRKIMVPVGHKNIATMFTSGEVLELRELFSETVKSAVKMNLISYEKIEANLIWN